MRPSHSQYPPYFETYISKVEGDDIHSILSSSVAELENFLDSIAEEKADFRYAPEKWTVKELIQHCIDTERIFAYRALSLARGEQQPLPGFDQDQYAREANVENKSLSSLKKEMLLVRQTSLLLLDTFTDKEWNRTGTVSGNSISVLALAFIIVGHWKHHQTLLTGKYGL